jgi:hypothetical protein
MLLFDLHRANSDWRPDRATPLTFFVEVFQFFLQAPLGKHVF